MTLITITVGNDQAKPPVTRQPGKDAKLILIHCINCVLLVLITCCRNATEYVSHDEIL